jgi:hypothetical protein
MMENRMTLLARGRSQGDPGKLGAMTWKWREGVQEVQWGRGGTRTNWHLEVTASARQN